MTPPLRRTSPPESPLDRLGCLMLKAMDAIERCAPMGNRDELDATTAAYIDKQLAKAIAWLASARSIAITQGNLSDPAFDDGEVWDWDDEIALAPAHDASGAKGGA
ncbi:MAG: hypothetical protein JOZ10_16115 [Acidobacteria bacterium]|nr:hypothetical protein [Acidobacteriota bacterium]